MYALFVFISLCFWIGHRVQLRRNQDLSVNSPDIYYTKHPGFSQDLAEELENSGSCPEEQPDLLLLSLGCNLSVF